MASVKGIAVGADGVARCWWCADDPLYTKYHDAEWGRPVDDETRLFEMLTLEGFQSGLSWITILRKRENFRRAFKGFDLDAVRRFNTKDMDRLLSDAGIVRHRGKIEAAINNARRAPDLIEEFGSLAAYIWSYEPAPATRPKKLDRDALMKLSTSPEATAMSKDLRRRGWAFVGPTTLYSTMEVVGVVNDHVSGCDVRDEVERERARFRRPAATTPAAPSRTARSRPRTRG
jgi:DNA-3-methyladenine glycosylase I